ncbi:MAG TPA: branched-chain amino acid ABC transporter permease [Candidatus Dormibacteraeota bacterium]|nr:branched-chain amino acid ABC transporter permease [Candidatus Dormibacteraeota bacterium]
MTRAGDFVRENMRNPNAIAYFLMAVGALFYPIVIQFINGGNGDFLVGLAADGGIYVLMAIGLNVVVGFAGLLDLGYAAFFAIGSYTYALVASNHMGVTPIGHSLHVPFWIALFIGMFVAAAAGALLGAPTLRLRGDYLAIVTLGFGEIVPRLFRNAGIWTGGVPGISALDVPSLPGWFQGPWIGQNFVWVSDFRFTSANLTAYYVLMMILITFVVILVHNLQSSRLGRAWMAVREDETAAAASGVNTVTIKLLAFSIGAATSGFAGAFYGAKLSYVSSENFGFIVSITVLAMVVLGGMGNIPGAMIGAIVLYFILFKLLPDAPLQMQALASSLGLDSLNQSNPNGWPGIAEVVKRSQYVIFGLILVGIMLLRPQGLLPSQIRKQELKHSEHEPLATPRQLQG